MNVRLINILFLIAFLFLALLSSALADDDRIGLIAPLTGPRSDGGEYMRRAMMIAQSDLRAQGRGNINIQIEDSAYDPKNAVAAFKKLVEFSKAKVVVGAIGSSEALAICPLAERYKIPLVITYAQSDEISQAGDYVFRINTSSGQESPFFAKYLAPRIKGEKLGVIAIQTAFSPSYLRNFTPTFKEGGGVIASIEEYASEELDFRSYLLRLRSKHINNILLLGTPRQYAHIILQAAQMKYFPKFFSFGNESKEIMQIAGSHAEGLTYAYSYDSLGQGIKVKEFRDKYVARFNEEPEAVAVNTYDALMLSSACLKNSSVSSAEIRDCLYRTKDYEGASGKFSIDKNGDAIKQMFIKEVREGKFVRVE